MGEKTNAVKQSIATAKSEEFLSLAGRLSIVPDAKDNLNPDIFKIKLCKCLGLPWGVKWPTKQ